MDMRVLMNRKAEFNRRTGHDPMEYVNLREEREARRSGLGKAAHPDGLCHTTQSKFSCLQSSHGSSGGSMNLSHYNKLVLCNE